MIEVFHLIDKKDYTELLYGKTVYEKIKQQSVKMELLILPSDNRAFSLFAKKNNSGNETEHCRVTFLEHKNIPDGFFIEVIDEHRFKFHIFELKLTPSNSLKTLGMQFYTGFLHIKALLSIMGISTNEIDISYYVGFVNDKFPKYAIQNDVNPNFRKFNSGEKLIPSSSLDLWRDNKVQVQMGDRKITLPIHKIKLNNIDTTFDDFTLHYDIHQL